MRAQCKLCEQTIREELGDLLERFAFTRLHEESALVLAGRLREAEDIAFWRKGVRDAADLVRECHVANHRRRAQ
jgi:hypothetical protein